MEHVTRPAQTPDQSRSGASGRGAAHTVVLFAVGMWAFVVVAREIAGVTIPWDAKAQFYNFFRFAGLALERGEWPLWNPFHFSGFPSVADPQSLLFTPTFLAFAWLLPQASMGQFDALVLAHLAMGGGALGLLMLSRGLALPAALAAVVIFMLGGPAMGRLQHVGLIVSYAWIPMGLLLLDRAMVRLSWPATIGFGVVAALMALGRDQIAYLGCWVLVAFAAMHVLASPERMARRVVHLVVMGLVAGALLIVPLVLTLQFAAYSNRPAVAFQAAAYGSLDPFNLIGLILANPFAGLSPGDVYWGPGSPSWPNFDWSDRSVNFLHAGLCAIALACLAAGRTGDRAGLRFASGIGLASLVYALGTATPVFRLLFDHWPGVAIYRRPADATFILMLALAWLAAVGLDRLIREGPTAMMRAVLACAAAVFVMVYGVALTRAPDADRVVASIVSAAAVALVALALMAIVMLARRTRRHGLWLLVPAVMIAELARNVVTPINAEPRSVYAVLDPAPSVDRDVLDQLIRLVADDHARGRYPRVEILGPERGWQNAAMGHGIEDTLGYNPLRYALYERATGAAENAHEPRLRPFPKSFRGYRSRLARLLGLEILVFDTPLERMPAGLPRLRLQVLREGPPYWVYRLPPAAPRVYLATRAVRVDKSVTLESGDIPDFALPHEALVDATQDIDQALVNRPAGETRPPGRVRITHYGLNSVSLVAETDTASLLVLHDLYYPGWTVTVNGEARRLLRANMLFRGVELGSGINEITFRFEPFSRENLSSAIATIRTGR